METETRLWRLPVNAIIIPPRLTVDQWVRIRSAHCSHPPLFEKPKGYMVNRKVHCSACREWHTPNRRIGDG